MVRPPVGIVEIEALYGNPRPFMRDDGTVSPFWELRMVKVELPGPLPLGWDQGTSVRYVRVNQIIAQEVDRVFAALKSEGLWDHIQTFDGAYCWRPKRGGQKVSMHGFGGAMDFNASENELGTRGSMNPKVVDVFVGHGWTWGGVWRRPDPMHFQWGSGY